ALFLGHVRGIVLQKAQNNPASKAARGAFFAKGAKNASCKKRAQVKVKTLGDESPRPSLFFTSKSESCQAVKSALSTHYASQNGMCLTLTWWLNQADLTGCDGLARQSLNLKASVTRLCFWAMFAGLFCKRRKNNPASLGLRAAHVSQKGQEMHLLKSALKGKVKRKTLGEESPRPSLFFSSKSESCQAVKSALSAHYPKWVRFRYRKGCPGYTEQPKKAPVEPERLGS
ncbi:MAG: hypothetical protein H7834_12995, partial [Magnetococcus sp. YQC-9]